MITTAVIGLSLVLQLVAAGLAIRLLWLTGRRVAWSLIAIAATFMAARRAIALAHALTGQPSLGTAQELVALAISVLMVSAVALLGSMFREADEAGRARQREQQRFREMLESLDVAIWEATPDGASLHYVSPATERIYGRPASAFYDNPELWREVVLPEDRELADRTARTLRAEGRSEGDYRIRRPDGEVRWVHDRKQMVHDEAGQPARLTGVATDITDRKEAEHALRQRNEQFTQLAANVPGVVFRLRRAPDGTLGCLYVSPGSRELFEIEPEAMQEDLDRVLSMIHPEDRPGWEAAVEDAVRLLEPREWEGRFVIGQRTMWVRGVARPTLHEDGAVVLDGMAVDVTEQKRTEQALQAELRDNNRLQEISTRLIPTEDVETLYEELVAAAVEIMGADRGTMQLLDEQTGELCLLAVRGMPREVREASLRVAPESIGTACTEAVRQGERVVVTDFTTDDRFGDSPATRMLLEVGIRAVQCTPLISRSGRMVGMISTHWDRPHQPEERQLRLMDILARQAADLIERRQAEQALRDSEQRFRAIFDQAAVGIGLLTADGQLTRFNQRFVDIVGYSEAELLAMQDPIHTLTHPDDRATEESQLAELLDGQRSVYEMEKRYVCKDGREVWVHLTASALRDEAGRVEQLIGVVEDITDRKEAERALQDSEQRFRRAVVESPVPVMIHAEDGEVLHLSGAWSRISGYSVEDIPTVAAWTERAHGAHADYYHRLIMDKHRREAGVEPEQEVTIRTRDGDQRHWLITSAPLGRLPDGRGLRQAVAVDISDRIEAEQALRESEQRFRGFAENSLVGLWQITPEGKTLYANPAMASLLEVDSPETLNGESIEAFYTEKGLATVNEEHHKRLRGQATVYEAELVGRRGTHRHVLVHGAPLYGPDGSFHSKFGTFVDITERKDAERRQKLLTDELDHRVKNNLASVMGLAARTLDASRSLSRFRESFMGRLRAMARTHDALARARWEGADLGEIARLVIGTFADEREQRLTLEGPTVLLPARLALPLSLALHELATNAVHHGALSLPGGHVELHWTPPQPDGMIRLNWEESGGPKPRKPRRQGVGLQLIEGLITYEAGGRLDMAFEPTGLRCAIDLPAPEPDHEPSPAA